jgi:hypothetical protein
MNQREQYSEDQKVSLLKNFCFIVVCSKRELFKINSLIEYTFLNRLVQGHLECLHFPEQQS